MPKKHTLCLVVTEQEFVESPECQEVLLDKGHQIAYLDLANPEFLKLVGLERCDGVIGQRAHRTNPITGMAVQSLKMALKDLTDYLKW